jgi:hypothetical protein
MPPVVVRLPDEDLSCLRVLANSRGQILSALLRGILIAYCHPHSRDAHGSMPPGRCALPRPVP